MTDDLTNCQEPKVTVPLPFTRDRLSRRFSSMITTHFIIRLPYFVLLILLFAATLFAPLAAADDTTPPLSTSVLSPSSPNGSNGWDKNPLSVTLSPSEDCSG